ncbi:gliding motility-associated C-terminal domain-containing protein [Olleya sp. Bg11-27]|uniref:gliding motility-associated C-terminal domain-containing protein n=1 Tax=Olleya sp. Bg11-27 TaxID=2058135 RepID=UPI0012FD0FD1|nr:gliding motility-associated C-terminal domain-containing protein [Olleya sp. Bg11-27]
MKNITYLVLVILMCYTSKVNAQCNEQETVVICDMTTIDNNNDGIPDGIINLYDQYNSTTGGTISVATGTWFDPDFNFALDEATGDLFLWDLDDSSVAITDYQFQLIDTNSACPDGIIATVNLVLGPFEGNPLPPQGVNDANITICESILSTFDLFQVFESQPSPHKNGIWEFVGNLGDPSNFLGFGPTPSSFNATIPYVPFGNLIEFDVFEFTYTVPGISPCSPTSVSNIKVEVIRDVFSGSATNYSICEDDILAGLWDNDINLTDDQYLSGEDVEGLWSANNDPSGQISNPLDAIINIREIYDFLKASNPMFSCETFTFSYTVEARSSLTNCSDKTTSISFTFFETIRFFEQEDPPLEICTDDFRPYSISLYDELLFTTENGIVYEYPNSIYTNWTLISGPSDLNIQENGEIILYDHQVLTTEGLIDIEGITNDDVGTYVFSYNVSSDATCLGSPCANRSAEVTLVIHPTLYAGEDTIDLEFCETDTSIASPLDLFTLLTTNGVDDPIYQGTEGQWLDNTGTVVINPITLPDIEGSQTFNYVYSTLTAEGCLDRANLSFTIFEAYNPGEDGVVEVCDTDVMFDLFDSLGGSPSTIGTWTGPNGYATTGHEAIFDPLLSEGGVYTYSLPDNTNTGNVVLCPGSESMVTVTLFQSPILGEGGLYAVCQTELQIDLFDYLDATADTSGSFIDIGATGVLTGSVLDVSQLSEGVYDFRYQIQGNPPCDLSSIIISISVIEVETPIIENQTFCATDGASISNLVANNGQDFNWYDNATDTVPLDADTILVDGADYFVTATDVNGCESFRVAMTVTLLPYGNPECEDCISDGVSANGDGQNDQFDLCSLPLTFPNFEIDIFNRYGTIVYKGNQNTPLFDGESNVGIGKTLPSGVYFYVFDPKDGMTDPFQGNFYLSR